MEYLAIGEVGEGGAGLEQEREGVEVGRRAVAEHVAVQEESTERGWAGGVGPEHGVVEEWGGVVVDGIKEETSVAERGGGDGGGVESNELAEVVVLLVAT